MTVYLVSCVAKKAGASAPARDLYLSDWFLKARAYVESRHGRWFILSARHGLVEPTQVLEPYNTSLHEMGADGRRRWGHRVAVQLATAIPDYREPLVVLAGKLYRDPLAPYFAPRCAVVPMAGLGIGQQKQWLAQHTPPEAP